MKNNDQDIELLTEEPTKEEIALKKKVNKANSTKKKIKLKKNSKIILISVIVIVVVSIVGFIIYKHYEGLNKVTIKDYELYQYFAGQKYEYTGELSLKRNGEITKLKYKDIELDIDSTPIYFKNKDNEMLLPTNMGFYILRIRNKNYKLPYFSRIYVDESKNDSSSFLMVDDEKVYLEKSILFDGNNLYVFLYDTTIVIDGKEIKLSPLSYISVTYQDEIYYYDKKNDEYVIIPSHVEDVIATIDGFKVNLSTDTIMYDNNAKLLIKNIDNLNSFK